MDTIVWYHQIPHIIVLLTHILKQNIAGSAYAKRPTPPSIIKKNEFRSSRGVLQANSVAEPSRIFNTQRDGEHSVDPPVRANTVASLESGDSP